jgi:F-type H+-transporting ATPase subunit a
MPDSTSLLHYLIYRLDGWVADGALRDGVQNIGHSAMGHHLSYKNLEPVFMASLVMLLILYFAAEVRGTYRDLKVSTVPEEELTLRTFFEVFFEYFYNMSKEIMGPANAKRYFPIIGASAIFIFISNAAGMVPGFLPPTSNLNITAGCALAVFVVFNFYGIRDNFKTYLAHLAGWGVFTQLIPSILLALLMLPIEIISTCVRPVTLAIRLMLNMSVDHLLVGILGSMVAILIPIPVMFLGIIVICVQTLVFCLLTAIYIGLATEQAHDH